MGLGNGTTAVRNPLPNHAALHWCPPGSHLQMDNQAALALVQRFMHNKREFDGTPTRDRFKLIPRIVNVAEWAEKGPLSGACGPPTAPLAAEKAAPTAWALHAAHCTRASQDEEAQCGLMLSWRPLPPACAAPRVFTMPQGTSTAC